jgi:hypothetical protein
MNQPAPKAFRVRVLPTKQLGLPLPLRPTAGALPSSISRRHLQADSRSPAGPSSQRATSLWPMPAAEHVTTSLELRNAQMAHGARTLLPGEKW